MSHNPLENLLTFDQFCFLAELIKKKKSANPRVLNCNVKMLLNYNVNILSDYIMFFLCMYAYFSTVPVRVFAGGCSSYRLQVETVL